MQPSHQVRGEGGLDGGDGPWWREMRCSLHFADVGSGPLGQGREATCGNSGEGDMNKLLWITKLGLCQLDHVTRLEFFVMVSFLFFWLYFIKLFKNGLLASDV